MARYLTTILQRRLPHVTTYTPALGAVTLPSADVATTLPSSAYRLMAVPLAALSPTIVTVRPLTAKAARAVLDAGRELWRYYHKQPKANPNASYYDIRKFFQGVKVDAKGKEKMNSTSGDGGYNERLAALKQTMKNLATRIEPRVYEYGFLKR